MSKLPPAPDSSSADAALVDDIRDHYDSLSPLYRRFWGEHIHHGFWRADESPAEAQENLVRELARRADIKLGERVLDVGCGLGGSSLFLAREYGATVKGISISPKQIAAARKEAHHRRLEGFAKFEVQDANRLHEDAGAYDVIWVVECSEHLADKPRFIAHCTQHLASRGRLAVCAWLAGENLNAAQKKLVADVQTGMLCPSFGTLADYSRWMENSGLKIVSADDITGHVSRTWSLCRPVLGFPLVKTMLAAGSRKLRAFADSFEALDEAYRTGAMSYGMFVAKKTPSS